MCIFAKQLYAVLERHNREIGSLHGIHMGDRRIHPQQILRLKQAAGGDCSISVALNPDELDMVINAFNLDTDDVRRLRAALTAESFYRFFLDRVNRQQTLELAEQFLQVMLSGDTRDFDIWKNGTFEDIREASDDAPASLTDRQAHIAHDLEPIIELYEEAQLWLTTAHNVTNSSRQIAYTQLALTLLSEAQDLLCYPTESVANTPEHADWQEIISIAIGAAQNGARASS